MDDIRADVDDGSIICVHAESVLLGEHKEVKPTGSGENRSPTCKEQLDEAARMVQDVAYTLANRVDSTTLTELMLACRKLERLSERFSTSSYGRVPLEQDETT